MTFGLLPYPYIDPEIIRIGSISIRWYGVMYVLAFVIGSYLLERLRRKRAIALEKKDIDDLVFYVTLGVVLGGRLGYVLFYNLPYFLQSPAKIIAVWEGGMSFHGGLLGVAVAGWLYLRKRPVGIAALADLLAVPSTLGLAFGRFGNFINAELVGRPSEMPWAVLFPGELVPRHPQQLYEMTGDLLLFAFLWWLYGRTERRGRVFAAFLTGYGVLRFLVEFTREPDAHIGYIGPFTLGQLLTVPMIIVGLLLLGRTRREDGKTPSGGRPE